MLFTTSVMPATLSRKIAAASVNGSEAERPLSAIAATGLRIVLPEMTLLAENAKPMAATCKSNVPNDGGDKPPYPCAAQELHNTYRWIDDNIIADREIVDWCVRCQ